MTEAPNTTPDIPPESAPVEAAAPKPPSRITRLLRLALRWAVGLGLVFLLGLLVTWFTQVRPKSAEIEDLRSQLESAQSELDALRPLESENQRLQAQADQARTRLVVVEALVDVTSAQVAVFMDDLAAARAHLAGTGARMGDIQALIAAEDLGEVEAMNARLEQVLAELDRDPFAARRDLEVLANSLATIARHLPVP